MNIKQIFVSLFLFAILIVPAVSARQEGKPEKKSKPVPSLDTEDVIPASTKSDKPAETPKTVEVKPDSKSDAKADAKPEAKTDAKSDDKPSAKSELKTDGDKTDSAKADQKDKDEATKIDPAEIEWRERLAQSREAVRQLRQRTQETELQLTEIRNNRYAGNLTPEKLNAAANAMNNNGQQLSILRQQLNAATQAMEEVASEGKLKGFHEAVKTPVTEKGDANEDYYKSRYVELVDQFNDADRRIKLYDFRVRDLRTQMEGNGGTASKGKKGGGDNFTGMQIQREIDQALIDMDLARVDLAKAREAIDALTEEARRAGLPPGIFRQ